MKFLYFFFIFLISFTNSFSNNPEEELIIKKYNLKIHTKLDNHFYGINWEDNNFNIRFQQISEKEKETILIVLDSCFSAYCPEIIKDCFNEIFLVHSISFNGEKMSVMNVANLLYVAADTTTTEIKKQIHQNIAEILFNKFHYLFPSEDFTKINPPKFNYGDAIPVNLLIKDGFINSSSTKSFKEDFINLSTLIFNTPNKVEGIKTKNERLKTKLELVYNFFRLIEPLKAESEIDIKKKNEIENRFNIKIDYDFSFFKFPNIWLKKNYQPNGTQIDDKNLDILLNYLNNFLERNRNSLEPYFLKKAVIIRDLKVNQKPTDIILYNSTLFLSDNFLNEISEDQYDSLIRNELFRLIYQNFNAYLPVESWNIINQNAHDSAYLSKYGKQYFYYDFRDFFFAFLDKKTSAAVNNPFVKKKLDITQDFYQTITKEIKSINVVEIKKTKTLLENRYHIKIIDFSTKKFNDFTLPHTLVINEKINLFQLKRSLNILKVFLEKIAKRNLIKYLKNIFLVENMEYLQGGDDKVGGTFETTQKSIFLANIGNNNDFLEGTLYHELSSIILYTSSKTFPKKEWLAVNNKDFYYQNLSNNEVNIYKTNKSINEKGFIDKYGTTCFENDYNEFFKLFLMNKEKLETLAKLYPKINQKYFLLQKYLKD